MNFLSKLFLVASLLLVVPPRGHGAAPPAAKPDYDQISRYRSLLRKVKIGQIRAGRERASVLVKRVIDEIEQKEPGLRGRFFVKHLDRTMTFQDYIEADPMVVINPSANNISGEQAFNLLVNLASWSFYVYNEGIVIRLFIG